MFPIAIHNKINSKSENLVQEYANYMEIKDVLDKFSTEMSGGQKQRVAAVRVLILSSEFLANEPTGALDSKNAKSQMEKLIETAIINKYTKVGG